MIKVSIVVAYNTQVEMTKKFLDCMDKTTENFRKIHTIELILVNGGCINKIEHPLITTRIDLETNVGFSVTVNEGLKLVSKDSDYIFYVGNDSFPTSNTWLEELILLQIRTGAGIVCPANDRPGMNAYKHLYQEDCEDYWKVEFFPSIAYLITNKCFNKVGLWDKIFINSGMYGDNDYCARARAVGETIVVSKTILLNHLLSQECKKLFNIESDMIENHKRYIDKWSNGVPELRIWYE